MLPAVFYRRKLILRPQNLLLSIEPSREHQKHGSRYKRAAVTITIAPIFWRFSLVSSAVDILTKSRFRGFEQKTIIFLVFSVIQVEAKRGLNSSSGPPGATETPKSPRTPYANISIDIYIYTDIILCLLYLLCLLCILCIILHICNVL